VVSVAASKNSGGSDRDSIYLSDQLRDDLATLLLERLSDEPLTYLHSSDLSERLDTSAKRVGRNLEAAAERAGIRAEIWAHNGNSTTWLVEALDHRFEQYRLDVLLGN
jgi:hypothetical protein